MEEALQKELRLQKKAEKLQKKYLVKHDGEVHWTPRQLLMITVLAGDLLKTKHRKYHRSVYNVANEIGMMRVEAFALARLDQFWDAVNDQIKVILGKKEYHKIAKSIFHGALNGNHHDRQLYLEVFCDHVKKSEVTVKSYEQILLDARIKLGKEEKETIVNPDEPFQMGK